MRNNSHKIALSAVAAALAVIFLVAGAYIPVFELTAYMLAEIAMMVPLCRKYYAGGFLAFTAAGAITLLFTGGNFFFILPFAIFFGLHPLANAFQEKYKINGALAFIVKAIWFDASVLLMYLFTDLFISDNNLVTEYILKYFYITIPLLGTAFFAFYDWFIMRAQKMTANFVNRLKF